MSNSKIKISFFPVIEKFADLTELYYKSAWLSFPLASLVDSITFPITAGLMNQIEHPEKSDNIFPEYLDSAIEDLPNEIFEKIVLINADDQNLLTDIISETDAVFNWNNSGLESAISADVSINILLKNKEIINVDKTKVTHDTWQYHSFFTRIDQGYNTILDRSQENFLQLKKIIEDRGYERAYVFGTGPSLNLVPHVDLSDGLSIVSNGIVLNRELMQYINPLVVTGIDPLYHSGPSVYAGHFRKMLREAIEKYDCYFITRLEFYRWFADYFPESLKSRIIGIPVINKESIPILNGDKSIEGGFNFFNGNGNVLNTSMLPLALSFCKEVNILGCDGRPPVEIRDKENIKYFWRHDSKSQIKDWEKLMYKVAPFYFDSRDFDKYFDKHSGYTARLIGYAQENGWNIRSRTPSYLPALAELYKKEQQLLEVLL